jgi:hypothetical protein
MINTFIAASFTIRLFAATMRPIPGMPINLWNVLIAGVCYAAQHSQHSHRFHSFFSIIFILSSLLPRPLPFSWSSVPSL